jgi:hypothetical protein
LIEGCFQHTGLRKSVATCVLDRHRPVLQVASDGSTTACYRLMARFLTRVPGTCLL